MASTLAYSTATDGSRTVRNDLLRTDWFGHTMPTDDDDEMLGCLGSQGVISTSSCNIIAARATGAWCPSCHPGDDVPISVAFQD